MKRFLTGLAATAAVVTFTGVIQAQVRQARPSMPTLPQRSTGPGLPGQVRQPVIQPFGGANQRPMLPARGPAVVQRPGGFRQAMPPSAAVPGAGRTVGPAIRIKQPGSDATMPARIQNPPRNDQSTPWDSPSWPGWQRRGWGPGWGWQGNVWGVWGWPAGVPAMRVNPWVHPWNDPWLGF